MTRDQFIYALTACGCLLKDGKTWYEHNELIKCFEDLGLFEQEPTTKNNLGVDLISRAEMLKYQEYLHGKMSNEENHKLWEFIKELPSVTPQEPKTGHWINTGDYYTGAYGTIDYVECSCCHYESLEEGDFCPNCGADMRADRSVEV